MVNVGLSNLKLLLWAGGVVVCFIFKVKLVQI